MLRVTDDGDTWRAIVFPPEAGAPTDITRWRGARVVLTERGLYRLDGDTPARVGDVPLDPQGRSPFVFSDVFCAAPLAVFRGDLYAGGQRDGSLWRFAPATP
ncbi:MAG: hypothetical protein HY909_03380 [Deltaproteobacteria bacterium]|nr:hypothetical protein [Deltaproteobacteria bacterium]